MSYMEIRSNNIAQEQGSSSWLTVLPIKGLGLNLSKSDFWDAVRLRYGLTLKRLPSNCDCPKPCNIQHAISCKGFVTLTHNELKRQHRRNARRSNQRRQSRASFTTVIR